MNWIHAAGLAGLAAVAIPIGIHLMRNRQTRVIELGTLRFLQEAVLQTQARRRLRELLLLAARILAVCLLAFLFARPLMQQEETGKNEASVILIDLSASLSGTALGKSNRMLAIEEAQKILDDQPVQEASLLAVYADVVTPLNDLDEVPKVARGVANHTAAIRWARERVSELKGETRRIYWITDLQPNAEDASIALPEDAAGCPVELIPLPLPGDWNAALEDVALATPTIGETAIITARAAVMGKPPTDLDLKAVLKLDGSANNGSSVSITTPVPADGRLKIEIPSDKISGSWIQGTITITGNQQDAWKTDDLRHFAYPVARQTSVLLVDGAPGTTRFEDSTYYLQHALALSAHNGGAPRYKISTNKLYLPDDLSSFKIIVLSNLPDVPPSRRADLRTFIENGGRVLYFLGQQCDPEVYATLTKEKVFSGTLAYRDVSIPRRLVDWERNHGALRVFDGSANADLTRVPVQDFFKVTLPDDAKKLAWLRDETPALWTTRVGKGNVTVFANPADKSWTTFVVSRTFIPFIHELFQWLSESDQQEAPKVEITSLSNTKEPGIIGSPPQLILTSPPQESRPTALSPDSFRAKFGLRPPEAASASESTELPEDRQRDTELWSWVAVALLLVTIGENLLADRMRS